MFTVGKAYRVFFERAGKERSHDGTLLEVSGDMLALDIQGVRTLFNVASGAVAYIEEVDAEAEAARDRARTDVWIGTFS